MEQDPDSQNVQFNTTFDSALIHTLARQAASRCDGKGDFDAIGAVILSYSALEAFLNESAQLIQTLLKETDNAASHSNRYPDSGFPTLVNFELAMRIAQEARATTQYRFDLAWETLSGEKLDRGKGLRQSLGALTNLRNDLVHAKAEESKIFLKNDPEEAINFDGIWLGHVTEEFKSPPYSQFFKSRNLISQDTENWRWIDRICSRDIADWACTTVEALTSALLEKAPESSEFKRRLDDYSLGGFVKRSRRTRP